MTENHAAKATHLPGTAADSPSNDYLAPGRYRESPPGWIAAGHRLTGSPVPGDNTGTVHLNLQAAAGPRVVELSTGGGGALASSIDQHTGHARVGLVDQAAAASPGMAAQFGRNAPGGLAPQAPQHTAPSTVGAEFRESPRRPGGPPAHAYNSVRGELQGPPPGSAA